MPSGSTVARHRDACHSPAVGGINFDFIYIIDSAVGKRACDSIADGRLGGLSAHGEIPVVVVICFDFEHNLTAVGSHCLASFFHGTLR